MKRIFALLLSACCLAACAADMSMHQQLFLLCVRKDAPAPQLPYDAEVEYITSNGGQYIDTGVEARDGLIVRAKIKYEVPTGSSQPTIVWLYRGTSRLSSVRNLAISIISTGDAIRPGMNTAMISTSSSITKGIMFETVVCTSSGAKFCLQDGQSVATSQDDSSLAVSEQNILLFTSTATASQSSGVSISSFSVEDAQTGKMIRNLKAVRFTNELGQNEGGMYDIVSGELFKNGGSGAFINGPDKGAQ